MPGSLRLGKIAGIDIYLHVSWILLVVLLSWSLATGWFAVLYPGWSTATYWVVSVLAALLLILAVLLHELAHSLVARARGLAVSNITLFIFGGISNLEQEPTSPGMEFQMAFVGPLTSLLIGGLSSLLWFLLRANTSPLVAILGYLAVANILLGIFNLVPGFPLDGGRVLRSIIWAISGSLRTATRVATLVGQIIAYLLIFSGLWLLFGGALLNGIWLGFIGWFLLNGAQVANSQVLLESILKGVTVGEVMNTNPPTVPANISLHKLVYEFLLPHGWRNALVTQGDILVGLITLSDIRHIAYEQWKQVPVGHAMIPLERLHTVAPTQPLNKVLSLMVKQQVNQLPVVSDNRLLGILSREDILRFVEIRQSLELGEKNKQGGTPARFEKTWYENDHPEG